LKPEGSLVLVATPIGNLGDLSPRAVAALREADVVCCEDTRRTRALLSASGVAAARRLVSLHEHNEAARIPGVLGWVADGRTVAVVTDAGTPTVSDPGARLVAAAAAGGLSVTVVPGPSAVLAALVVSGLPTDRFCVEGFLPRKGGERRRRIEALVTEDRTAVVLEAPGRLAGTLAELAGSCGDRPGVVARELTKVHEEIWRGSLPEAAAEFAARQARGEVVVVLGGAPPEGPPSATRIAEAVAERVAAGDSARHAAERVSGALGVSRRRAYELAIALRSADRAGDAVGGPPAGDSGTPG
jgi:16S rRNA (cytidine1402-2'-O)-methyltransferase